MNSFALSQHTVDALHANNVVPLRSTHDGDSAGLGYVAADDGHSIPVRHWPRANALAVIHIAHGMAEHSGCYEDVAPRLNAAGYAVIAHDHRCHGLSVPQGALGNVSARQHWRAIGSDMLRVNSHARSLYPGKPVVLLGHSMGSFISLDFAEAHSDRIDVLLLEGSNYEAPWFCKAARGIAVFESWRQGKDGRSPAIHALSFGGFNKTIKNPRTAYDWISRNIAFVDRYAADPLCGFQCSNGYWKEFLAGLARIYTPRNIANIRQELPIYLFAGSDDPVGRRGRGVMDLRKQLEKNGRKPVQVKLYAGARHDILHETNQAEITRDLLDWLGKTLHAMV
jgi:alpha-beta hydrolase superfamily lysophospholipase